MAFLTSVVYHNIGDETSFEAGLGVTIGWQTFRSQIAYLARNYDVIGIGDLLDGKLPRRPLLISFDDCYASSRDAARDILTPMGLPSVFFINPGLLGPDGISLDSVLAKCASGVGLDVLCAELDIPRYESLGNIIAVEMAKLGAARRLELKEHLQRKFGMTSLAGRSPLLSREDVSELHRYGMAVGNHTLSHVHCRALGKPELQTEITTAKLALEAMSGRPVRAFALPYGNTLDLTPELLSALRMAGHEAIFLVGARSTRFRPAKDVWYRVSVPEMSVSAMPAKLTVLPLLRSIRDKLRW